jgi:hypothetical protein
MRIATAALTTAALVIAAPLAARADRGTVLTVGLTGDGRASGETFANAGRTDVRLLAGARLTVSFEDPPLAMPPPGDIAAEVRLAPELLTGFLADDVHAEGYVGAGVRGELWLASHRRSVGMRTAVYAAARAIVIGGHRDGAVEAAIGEYLSFRGGSRFGWEGGALIRPRADAAEPGPRELDALVTIYVGW